jgi:hypothetical protein
VQLYIAEHNYAHGTRVVFDLGEVSLLRLTTPVIGEVAAPRHVLLPQRALAFSFDVLGMATVASGSHTVVAKLEPTGGSRGAEVRQDLANPLRLALSLSDVEPGNYNLRLTILDASGKECSESTQPLTLHAGPLH